MQRLRLLAIPAALAAAGCSVNESTATENVERVENGMSQDEVRALLGEPSFTSEDIGGITRWVYEKVERSYAPLRETTKTSAVVTFANGKVITVERKNPGS